MPNLVRIAPAAVLAAAIALSAAACGSAGTTSPLAGLTADQIITKAVHDLSLVSSVREDGTQVSSGQGIAVDIVVVRGQGCQGTMNMPASSGKAGSGPIGVVDLDSTLYVKYDQSYLKKTGAPAALIPELSGKYLEMTSGSAISDFAQTCDLSDVVSSLEKDETGFTKIGTATINGQAALGLKGKAEGQNGIFYVSESATPEILRFQSLPASEGSVNFTDYNAKTTITAPPANEVVNIGSLGS